MSVVGIKPRVGFLGFGWIGRKRFDAVAPIVEDGGIADPAISNALSSLDELLERGLDAVVIATPSALHAEQAIAALEAGLSVFCQKPLGRTANEATAVVAAARAADRLLAVDFCYRSSAAARAVRAEQLGSVYAVEAVFHNAYGPDAPWFYDPSLAGGGCVIDLGIHLVDLVLSTLDWPQVVDVDSRLLHHHGCGVEDYAAARLELDSGAIVSLACSWHLQAGRDCVIECRFHGTDGGAAVRNVDGSFYDLRAERYHGTATEGIVDPPDDWGARPIREWAEALTAGAGYDPAVECVLDVHEAIDRIYGRSG